MAANSQPAVDDRAPLLAVIDFACFFVVTLVGSRCFRNDFRLALASRKCVKSLDCVAACVGPFVS